MKDEIALVTGAASGIGRAAALRLAARGAAVGLLDRDANGLDAVVKEIALTGGSAIVLPADITVSAEVAAAVACVGNVFGGLDTVVSCAGILKTGLVPEIKESDWLETIAVNLTGTFLLAHHAIPWLIGRGGGSFVAISSDAGVQGASGYAAYCASKHGVIGLIRCLALDHGSSGVRSNAICPGFVETPMTAREFATAPAGTEKFFENVVPMGRFARPEEVANVVAHLSSPEASYSNGMVYALDGGSTAGYYTPSV